MGLQSLLWAILIPAFCVAQIAPTFTSAPDATGTATVSAILLFQSGTANYTSPFTLSLSISSEPSESLVLSYLTLS